MKDTSLFSGINNFFFHNSYTGSGITGDDNYYAVFMDKNGEILIMRLNADNDTARYFVATGDYDTVVANRGIHTYKRINELKNLSTPDPQ